MPAKRPVEMYDLSNGKTVKTFPSASNAGRELYCSYTNIVHTCNGRHTSCLGYGWRYAKNSQVSKKAAKELIAMVCEKGFDKDTFINTILEEENDSRQAVIELFRDCLDRAFDG